MINNRMIETAMDGVLDTLLTNDGTWTAPFGRVLTSLATRVFGVDVAVGDPEYHAVSRAVIQLEELDLIVVTRVYGRDRYRANVLQSIRLQS